MSFLTIFVILVFWWNVIHRPRQERERKVMEEQARKNMALRSHARLEIAAYEEYAGDPKPQLPQETGDLEADMQAGRDYRRKLLEWQKKKAMPGSKPAPKPAPEPNICSSCYQEIPNYDWVEYDRTCSGCLEDSEGV